MNEQRFAEVDVTPVLEPSVINARRMEVGAKIFERLGAPDALNKPLDGFDDLKTEIGEVLVEIRDRYVVMRQNATDNVVRTTILNEKSVVDSALKLYGNEPVKYDNRNTFLFGGAIIGMSNVFLPDSLVLPVGTPNENRRDREMQFHRAHKGLIHLFGGRSGDTRIALSKHSSPIRDPLIHLIS